jgi:hypothetical protein
MGEGQRQWRGCRPRRLKQGGSSTERYADVSHVISRAAGGRRNGPGNNPARRPAQARRWNGVFWNAFAKNDVPLAKEQWRGCGEPEERAPCPLHLPAHCLYSAYAPHDSGQLFCSREITHIFHVFQSNDNGLRYIALRLFALTNNTTNKKNLSTRPSSAKEGAVCLSLIISVDNHSRLLTFSSFCPHTTLRVLRGRPCRVSSRDLPAYGPQQETFR